MSEIKGHPRDMGKEELEQALLADPENAGLWAHLGTVLLKEGDFRVALSAFEQVVRLDTKGQIPSIHSGIGQALSGLGRDAEAAAAYKRSVEGMPSAASYVLLADTQLTLGKTGEAEASLRRALALEPDNEEALAELNRIGLAEITAQLKTDPENAELLQCLGRAHARRGEYRQAEGAYRRSLRLDPTDPFAHMALGSAYYEEKRDDEALEEFKIAHELAPDLATPLWLMGDAHTSLGNNDAADECYHRAVEVEPEDERAQQRLARWKRFLAEEADQTAADSGGFRGQGLPGTYTN